MKYDKERLLHYLYRHVRPDTNEVFYIGIGTKQDKDFFKITSEYERAYTKAYRNKHWHNIVKLNPNYKIEVLLESNDYDFIKEKEKEFIKLYGRTDLNTGTLCNKTEGGEGISGFKHSKESKEKQSKKAKLRIGLKNSFYGKKHSQEFKDARSKPIVQLDMNGNFINRFYSILEAARVTKCFSSLINKVVNGERHSHKNFIWIKESDFSNLEVLNRINKRKESLDKTVVKVKNIKSQIIYNSITEASLLTRDSVTKIQNHSKKLLGDNYKYEWVLV